MKFRDYFRDTESIDSPISAGVGRTGTFIAIDIMLQRMRQEGKINIFDLVKQLRLQRMKMVQTVDQYAFLYTSGLEMAKARTQHPQGMTMNRLNGKTFFIFFSFTKFCTMF
jgi:protein tyrosine phosphatase